MSYFNLNFVSIFKCECFSEFSLEASKEDKKGLALSLNEQHSLLR